MAYTDADVQKAVELTDKCVVTDPQEDLQKHIDELAAFFATFDEADSWEISKRACQHIINRPSV